MVLNENQRLVVILGVALLAGMTLFPPWEWLGQLGTSAGGYGFIFTNTENGAPGDRVDTARLLIQLWVVVTATIGLVVALARPAKDAED